jgi:hypothetical protein
VYMLPLAHLCCAVYLAQIVKALEESIQ